MLRAIERGVARDDGAGRWAWGLHPPAPACLRASAEFTEILERYPCSKLVATTVCALGRAVSKRVQGQWCGSGIASED